MTQHNAEGLVVVLTGATEGIGREIALLLAKQQAKLVLAARNRERLDEIVNQCLALGGDALGVPTDVAEEAQCRALIDQTRDAHGRLDMLINNAGFTMWTTLAELEDLSVLERLMRVNYLGAAYLTHAALPLLKVSRGRIVAVASLAGLTGIPTRSGYAASKHAMFGFFESLRIELRDTGISVTLIAPDFVHSQIHKRALTADGTPLGESPLQTHKIMTAAQCAEYTVTAALARKRLKIMTVRGHLLRWLRIMLPGLVDRMSYNAITRGK